ncbi:2'-5'-oligoadenylate synthase [Gracilaria domingensis]|nr:2'-5'-oligoadenylate synthase [Gracilaria domingensis]
MVSNLHLEPDASNETPWGLSWAELFTTLRPSQEEAAVVKSIISQVEDVLKIADLSHDLRPGGSFGKKTMLKGDNVVYIYSIQQDFRPQDYFESHLKPILVALKADKRFVELKESGYAAVFNANGMEVSSEKDSSRVLPDVARGHQLARDVHVETSCSILRMQTIANQAPLYHDLVRVAKKWRSTSDFMSRADTPGDYLIELLMLEAFTGAPCMPHGPELYGIIFRRFLSLAATQCGSGSDVMADDSMPKSMLWWDRYFNRGVIDMCMAKGMLDVRRSDLCSIIVVDPAAPFVNVARSVPDWTEMRRCARESLSSFQNTDLLDSLQDKVQALTEGMREAISGMQNQLETLQRLANAPRRWSGVVQFNEVHMNNETWTTVMDVELHTIPWRLYARKARTDGTGYMTCVDISLQMMGKKLEQTMDVDVSFRGGTSNLAFGPNADHVLICRRSEIVRNRDYTMQITVIG